MDDEEMREWVNSLPDASGEFKGRFDPLDFLVDRSINQDGYKIATIEQPHLHCPCAGTGWLGAEWLYKRESHCSCAAKTDDFENFLHQVHCDSVPCPFCPLES